LQNTPKIKEKKKSINLKEIFSAKKSNKDIKKIHRYSENFEYKKEGVNLEKSIKKISISNREPMLFQPIQTPQKYKRTSCISPVKRNTENAFDKLLMESEKHASSKYLILDLENNENNLHYLVILTLKHFLKKN